MPTLSNPTKNQVQQVIQQTVVKQVTDDKTLQDIATLKRMVEFLKKENKSTQDDIIKGLADQKRHFSAQLTQQQKQFDALISKQIQTLESNLKNEIKELNTLLTKLMETKYDSLDLQIQNLANNSPVTGQSPNQNLQTQGSSAQQEKPQSAARATKIDEADIKRIVNASIHRVSLNLSKEIDELKHQMSSQLKDLQTALNTVNAFDQSVKMTQVQVRQLYKELRQTGDKFGEQVFNLEEKTSEFQKATMDKLSTEIQKFTLIVKDFENNQEKVLQQLQIDFINKIQEGIAAAFPAFNMQIMDQVSTLMEQMKQLNTEEMMKVQEETLQRISQSEQFHMDFEVKLYQERSKRENEDRSILEKLDQKFVDIKQLIEIKFSRKQKTKVDFLIEIRNMHQQMKNYNQKMKESLTQQEVIVDLFHYLKLMELEMLKVTQYIKYFELQDASFTQEFIQVWQQQQSLQAQLQQKQNFKRQSSINNNNEVVDPVKKNSQKEQIPTINIEKPPSGNNVIKLDQLQKSLEYFDSRVGQMKTLIKSQMKDKCSNFQTTHDIDVEIDYIADQFSRMQSDQIMQMKINVMRQEKQAQEQNISDLKNTIFKSTSSRMSTLEQLLVNSNQQYNSQQQQQQQQQYQQYQSLQNPQNNKNNNNNNNLSLNEEQSNKKRRTVRDWKDLKQNNQDQIKNQVRNSISVQDQGADVGVNTKSRGVGMRDSNPYQLEDIKQRTAINFDYQKSPNATILSQINSDDKRLKNPDITPIQMKTQFLAGQTSRGFSSRNLNFPHQLYSNFSTNANQTMIEVKQNLREQRMLSSENMTLSERSMEYSTNRQTSNKLSLVPKLNNIQHNQLQSLSQTQIQPSNNNSSISAFDLQNNTKGFNQANKVRLNIPNILKQQGVAEFEKKINNVVLTIGKNSLKKQF